MQIESLSSHVLSFISKWVMTQLDLLCLEHFNGDCRLDIPEMLFTSIFFQVQTNNLYSYATLLGAAHYH